MPTISIITPCKNIISEGRSTFFCTMMAKLRSQTFQDFELIIIDGGSKDGTDSLLHDYTSQIDLLISEPDKNLHEAINKGLKHARGEFIYVMNSDDYFADNQFFERSLSAIRTHNVDFTHGDRIIVKRDGSLSDVKKGDERVAFFRMPFRWQTMLIKKAVYDEIGPFDERFIIASDYKFMMQMLLAGKRGHYFAQSCIYSLDGGITSDRERCISEVSEVLYDVYGKKYDLSLDDCRQIYTRRISPTLFEKIKENVSNKLILDSLTYCYKIVQRMQTDFFPQVPLENFLSGLCNVELPQLEKSYNGKIRNNWIVSDKRIILTTDLQYAHVRPVCAVPYKGMVSNLISAYWFNVTKHILPNHLIKVIHPQVMVARQANLVFPVEVVVRRYMARSQSPTSIYSQYTSGRRKIYGIDFPDNIIVNAELPMGTIVTPTTKASDGHDKEINDAQAREIIDKLSSIGTWDVIRNVAISVFDFAYDHCLSAGIILADTKFEFGLDSDGKLMLIDEILTPDCSRMWLRKTYKQRIKEGKDPELNKELLVSWLSKHGFDGTGEVPIIEKKVIDEVSALYKKTYTFITGNPLDKHISDEESVRDAIIKYISEMHD